MEKIINNEITKSKKGFTLIELLAIIVILAIIAVITVPLMLGIIDDSKKKTAENSAYGYIDAIDKLYISKIIENRNFKIEDGTYESNTLINMGLSITGKIPEENSWIKIIDKTISSACLQFDEYKVEIENNKIINVEKEECPMIFEISYKQLEYIQSTDKQYIDTETQIFKTENHEIIFEFEPTRFYDYVTLWGTSYDADTFESWIYRTGALAGRYNNVRYGKDTTLNLNTKYTVREKKEENQLSMYLNGNNIGTNTVNNKLVDSTMYILKSANNYGAIKIYNVKIYSENILIRDYKPCYRKKDNKPGLFDIVNNKFYTNDGPGEFIKGPEI